MEHFRAAMLKLNSNVGLVVVDEGTEEPPTDQERDSVSNASTIPDECRTTTSVYAIIVPPWYTQAAATATSSATGNERFVVDRMRFSMGELRTCTWKITRPSADSLVGHLMRSAEGDLQVHVISPAEYKGRRTKQRARPPRDHKDRPKPPVVEIMDWDLVKFMKRKRDGGGLAQSQ